MKDGTHGMLKFKKLQRRLKMSRWQVTGVLESLWQVTKKDAPQGDIGKFSDEDIALQIEWDGDPAELIEALVDNDWLVRDENCRLMVHHWPQHCDQTVHRTVARRKERFADGSIPNLNALNQAERDTAREFYAANAGIARSNHNQTEYVPGYVPDQTPPDQTNPIQAQPNHTEPIAATAVGCGVVGRKGNGVAGSGLGGDTSRIAAEFQAESERRTFLNGIGIRQPAITELTRRKDLTVGMFEVEWEAVMRDATATDKQACFVHRLKKGGSKLRR